MREYAPDQTVFMFTISAVERRGHRWRAGVFPDGLAVLPGCALSGKWCAARCACQGRYPPKVDPCAEYQFPGRVCLSGRFPPKGTAPEAGMVRGCSVEGARPGVHDRSLHAGFSGGRAWGDCVCIARLFISSGRHVRRGWRAALSGADRCPACRWRARRRCWAPWHRWGCAGWRTGSARSGCPWRA